MEKEMFKYRVTLVDGDDFLIEIEMDITELRSFINDHAEFIESGNMLFNMNKVKFIKKLEE